jgi:mannose-6-phosphate isomerase-like protein (cupin superfamily)
MQMLPPYKVFKDYRGTFRGIVNTGEWKEINFVETVAGEIRGGHYHKHTRELFYIISGDIEVIVSRTSGESEVVYEFHGGEAFIIEPMEVHAFRCKSAAVWINALSERIDERVPDIYTKSKEAK